MHTKRVLKKISTPFEAFDPQGAILMVNMVDPQVNTMKVFLEAVEKVGIPFFGVANKTDLVDGAGRFGVEEALGLELIPASMSTTEGLEEIRSRLRETFAPGDRIAVLGVFNSGKTSLISNLTGLDLVIGNLPGTTLEFTAYSYGDYVLIDTVGQIIDVSKPMMVSVDLSGCESTQDRVARVLRQDAEGIMATLEVAVPSMERVVGVLRECIERGNKIIVTGAGASALVAMEMAGQGLETGVPIMVFTNTLGDMQPVSFAKGTGEEEAGLSRYLALAIREGDVVIGISASGGTGFVYNALERARARGAITVAITENVDTPLGQAADYVIKSNAKPEGPSSSKVQAAHLAIGHALLLTLADERGVTADESIEFMLPEVVPTKKMGIK
ncbi:MAG TPA: SIS domain-containing protein [Anaerolineae bacterium]|nr:SIS domain-containing protein [Anaerolineae bacterium]